MNTDRRPLGNGPAPAENPGVPSGQPSLPRAGLVAERIQPTPDNNRPTLETPPQPNERRTLGTGPTNQLGQNRSRPLRGSETGTEGPVSVGFQLLGAVRP